MPSNLKGTITKYIRKPNLMSSLIDAIENGNNNDIFNFNHLIYSEYENWIQQKPNEVLRKSEFIKNIDANGNVISYGFPTYGYAWANKKVVDKVATYTSGLLKTYNRIYFDIDPSQCHQLNLTFKIQGNNFTNLDKTGTLSDYTPKIVIGAITNAKLKNHPDGPMLLQDYLNRSDGSNPSNYRFYDTYVTHNLKGSEEAMYQIDLRDFHNEPKLTIVVTIIESGELLRNSNYDPDEDTEIPFIPFFTCSAPDLIDISTAVFNSAPTPPKVNELYHIDNNNLYPDISSDILIEGLENCLVWEESIDLDDNSIKDTLNMGKFTLPLSLSKGDIDKDGKIDKEDLTKLDNILNNKETFIDDDFGLWATTIVEKDYIGEINTEITEDTLALLNNHIEGNAQISSEVYNQENWISEWKVDSTNNLYYLTIQDERVTEDSKIELYNEYFYNLNTFKYIECYDKYFKIYVSCCPTGLNFFVQKNYDGEQKGTLLSAAWEIEKEKDYLQVEYKIVEEYKNNILKKSNQDNISYELKIYYDNEDIDNYWIFPEGKDYLDIPFIQDLYYAYCNIYSERTEIENKEAFLKLLPKKVQNGYKIRGSKLYEDSQTGLMRSVFILEANLPPISEEEQAINNAYMFKTQIKKVELSGIDYYGMTSNSLSNNLKNNIYYPNNTDPTPPSKVIFLQEKNNISLIGSGSLDNDTNQNYINPQKDILRYEYQNEKKESINNILNKIKFYDSKEGSVFPPTGLGDFTHQGKIDEFSLIRLYAYMHKNFIPSLQEMGVFEDVNGDYRLDDNDITFLKKYIENNKPIVFPGMENYYFNDPFWLYNSEIGLYETYTPLEKYIPESLKNKPIKIILYNYELFNLQTFVKGEIFTHPRDDLCIKLYFKTPPNISVACNYSIQESEINEVKLYQYTDWYPTPVSFTINKKPDEVEYIKIRARATDRMVWSDWKEFEGVAYPDIWLGTRNCLIGGLNDIMTGSPYIISATPPVSEKDKEKLWYCNDPSNERYETLSIWNGTEWVPNTTVNSLKNKNVWYKSATPPSDTSIFWIDTDEDEGGLKHYENGEWVPVSVIWS